MSALLEKNDIYRLCQTKGTTYLDSQSRQTVRSGSLLLTEGFPPPLPGQLSFQVTAVYNQHKSSCCMLVSGLEALLFTHTLELLPKRMERELLLPLQGEPPSLINHSTWKNLVR